MIAAQLLGCKTVESTLSLQNVRNYDPGAANHILFLDFKITKRDGRTEIVELVNAVSGSGKLKNLATPVHSPYQISVIPRYSVSHAEIPLVFEHPLYKFVEVASQDGKLSKQDLHTKEGNISVRIQKDNGLEKLEIHSLTPDKGNIKIYTLNLK
ncbi:hypothetical protein MUK70_07855 [Dyadobacter chenwenxiniae]|uniref:Uncharacterized protein n=1 Tax=Dyadobacter chenwenxiniae TaxID=2906456 RepID=A0A9X1PM43_9BACT|nr:hypothetical protein [Dyadobacter chenwenxiniae]MCF0062930.1 hypothetical protein [Dyadobacter chenwenxiniae]UON84896.1 hypothetical protein MUK70_07855 [Dyadobacter chenwenxiniae]